MESEPRQGGASFRVMTQNLALFPLSRHHFAQGVSLVGILHHGILVVFEVPGLSNVRHDLGSRAVV